MKEQEKIWKKRRKREKEIYTIVPLRIEAEVISCFRLQVFINSTEDLICLIHANFYNTEDDIICGIN